MNVYIKIQVVTNCVFHIQSGAYKKAKGDDRDREKVNIHLNIIMPYYVY